MPGKNLKLNQFKLLGINYDAFTEDKTAINLKKKTNRKKKNIVKFMDLSGSGLYGKKYSNNIISNANPNPISHCFAQTSDKIVNEIQSMFYSFLWSGKPDKIKRKVMIGQSEEG